MERLVIYTCLTGDKEPLGRPLERLESSETDLDIQLICLTDSPKLQSDQWQVVTFNSLGLPPEKSSRMPKALPHSFFGRLSRFSLYVDNTVQFRRLPNSNDLATHRPYLFKLFRHNGRNTIIEEAAAIASLGYDSSANLIEQLEHYASIRPLESITPLSTCTVMLRDHSSSVVQRHGEHWWAQILAFTKRDQMSFDFSRLETECEVEYLPGNKHENDLVFAQDNFSHRRVLANFDTKRYLWVHRYDPKAKDDPKAHFRASDPSPEISARFSKRSADPLDLYCHLFRSSMGSSISPRRQVSRPLNRFLTECMDKGARDGLGINIASGQGVNTFEEGDFQASCQALQALQKGLKFQTARFSDATFSSLNNPFSALFDVQQVGLIVICGLKLSNHLSALHLALKGFGHHLERVCVLFFLESACHPQAQVILNDHLEEIFAKQHKRSELLTSEHDGLQASLVGQCYLGCFERKAQ